MVTGFLSGRDVFAVLPTGFRKSICYACIPSILADLDEEEDEPIIVVCGFEACHIMCASEY